MRVFLALLSHPRRFFLQSGVSMALAIGCCLVWSGEGKGLMISWHRFERFQFEMSIRTVTLKNAMQLPVFVTRNVLSRMTALSCCKNK